MFFAVARALVIHLLFCTFVSLFSLSRSLSLSLFLSLCFSVSVVVSDEEDDGDGEEDGDDGVEPLSAEAKQAMRQSKAAQRAARLKELELEAGCLTAEEKEEQQQLLDSGFPTWNKRYLSLSCSLSLLISLLNLFMISTECIVLCYGMVDTFSPI